MIYRTIDLPRNAQIGDAWVGPREDFKRVLSRGGAWENVNLGSKHPDEKDHDDEQSKQPEAEQRVDSPEVSLGTGESPPGDGDDGQMSGSGHVGEGPEDAGLTELSVGDQPEPIVDRGEGVDGVEPSASSLPGVDTNGSEVV